MTQLLADLNKLAKGVSVKPRLLARDRKKIRRGLLLPLIFIAAYAAIQLLFTGLETLNNSLKQKNASQKTTPKTAAKPKAKDTRKVVPNK
jgi:hypothetical protein